MSNEGQMGISSFIFKAAVHRPKEHLGCKLHGVYACACVCVSLSNQCEDKTNTSKRNELWAAGQKPPDDLISVHIWRVKNNSDTHAHTHMALTLIITGGNKFTQTTFHRRTS